MPKKDNGNTYIDTTSFESSARHWYNIFDTKNIINSVPHQPKYKATEITNIADNILLYQRDNGGWPKNYDVQAILSPKQKDSLILTKNILHTTFDNSTTYTHIEYLAQAYYITGTEKYKNACMQGLDFILSAQYPNGGWPQYFPLEKGYSRLITFNDNAMIGIMVFLKGILDNKPYYSFIDSTYRIKSDSAFQKGLDCILKCQIIENGKLTAWCQQHNEVTLKPAWARAFEPPAISNQESAGIVLFLMSIDNPGKKIITAVQGAVKWFEDSKIYNTRVNTIKAPEKKYKLSISRIDRVVVIDSTAPPIWTRYYELGTFRPLFCDRDSQFLYSLAEVSRERRAGYGWYTYEPQQVLKKYEKWKKRNQSEKNLKP